MHCFTQAYLLLTCLKRHRQKHAAELYKIYNVICQLFFFIGDNSLNSIGLAVVISTPCCVAFSSHCTEKSTVSDIHHLCKRSSKFCGTLMIGDLEVRSANLSYICHCTLVPRLQLSTKLFIITGLLIRSFAAGTYLTFLTDSYSNLWSVLRSLLLGPHVRKIVLLLFAVYFENKSSSSYVMALLSRYVVSNHTVLSTCVDGPTNC